MDFFLDEADMAAADVRHEQRLEHDIKNHLSSLFRICQLTVRPGVLAAEVQRMSTSLIEKRTGPAAPAVFEVMAAAVQAAINNAAVFQEEAVVHEDVVAQDAAVAQDGLSRERSLLLR